jgi:uncharacterized UPF0160 family protein
LAQFCVIIMAMKNNLKHVIVTHAGAFHADELMAIVLLERFYLGREVIIAKNLTQPEMRAILTSAGQESKDVEPEGDSLTNSANMCPVIVVRTRGAELLKTAKLNPHVFVIDVGGELDTGPLNFDHHQESMRDTWPDGAPLSSTGLIWLWLQKNEHLSALSTEVQKELEGLLIRPLDAHDNGLALCREGEVVGGYNRSAVNPAEQLEQFEKALDFMREVLNNFKHQVEMKIEAERVLKKAWTEADLRGETFVILGEALRYPDGTGLLDKISGGKADLLAIPGAGSRYSVISLPLDDKPFSIRCPAPKAWRGNLDFDITVEGKKIKIPFAHKNGFMCIVEGGGVEVELAAKHIIKAHRAMRDAVDLNGAGDLNGAVAGPSCAKP